jgi:hypothetical protein
MMREDPLHDPMAQAVSDIHRHADEMIGFATVAALCAVLTGWWLLWAWWPLAAGGAIATLVTFLAFLDARTARDRAFSRRETILARSLLPDRPRGRDHGLFPRAGLEADGGDLSAPLAKPSA